MQAAHHSLQRIMMYVLQHHFTRTPCTKVLTNTPQLSVVSLHSCQHVCPIPVPKFCALYLQFLLSTPFPKLTVQLCLF